MKTLTKTLVAAALLLLTSRGAVADNGMIRAARADRRACVARACDHCVIASSGDGEQLRECLASNVTVCQSSYLGALGKGTIPAPTMALAR